MSFLFGKKKPSPGGGGSGHRETNPASGSNHSSSPATGTKEKDKTMVGVQETTPSSSVNNSLNSLGRGGAGGPGATTPSPEHGAAGRGDHSLDGPYRSRPVMTGPPTSNGTPNASLYPWSQRRLAFTTSQPNPFPRYGAAVNATSSKEGDIYLMGGLVNGQIVKGDLWMIEAGGGNLDCYPIGTTSEGPGPRVGHASLLVGNAFIVFGGDTKQDDNDPLDDTLYLLNTSTRQWSRALPPTPRPAGRYGHTLNILGSKIYIFGGQVDGHFFNDLIAFDLNALQNPNNKWEFLIQDSMDTKVARTQVPLGRTNHTIVTYNDKLYLFGGTDGIQWFNDVWTYDPRSNAWMQLDCIGYIPQPREGHSAALVNDVMYIFGGRTQEGNDLGDLAAFRITSRRWYTFQNMGPAPSPRSGHSMTAYGNLIVVLAGEPSSAPRDPGELSLVYVLDTAKIRYPNDHQIQQTPSGERVLGSRRPSTEKSAMPQGKQINPRDAPSINPDTSKRFFSGPQENVPPISGPMSRGPDPALMNGQYPIGPSTRFPRSAANQAPSGPPPQQQAPPPRPNGVMAPTVGPRSRTPTRDAKDYDTESDSTAIDSFDRQGIPPGARDPPRGLSSRAMSPVTNGPSDPRSIQTQQPSRLGNASHQINEIPQTFESHKPEFAYPEQPEFFDEFEVPGSQELNQSHSIHQSSDEVHDPREEEVTSRAATDKIFEEKVEKLTTELEAAKNRNAWYESELALARKAGYNQATTRHSVLEDKSAQSFDDDEKPLVQALIAMKAELAEVQSSVGSQIQTAAQQVAEAEQQRDAAIKEAVYAKAKLAAHGGTSTATVAETEDPSTTSADSARSTDMTRKLGSALAIQSELRAKVDSMTSELQAEKRARKVAEETAEAAHRRITELEQVHNPAEIESLRAELHEAQKTTRELAAQHTDAHAKAQLLDVDKEDLTRQLQSHVTQTSNHVTVIGSLREAITASNDKTTLLEKKLEEERDQHEIAQRKLLQLKSEHEERTAELETTNKKLRDAEELADRHASEAQKHRDVVLSGLEKIHSRDVDELQPPMTDERVLILQQQVEEATMLMKKSQADADAAGDKLRSAEERIAGLEAYQEQASRENLTRRKQLQDAEKSARDLQAEHAGLKQQLESHQRDASAMMVQHNALKELLDERSMSRQDRSRNLDSASGYHGSPDTARLRELEQQLDESRRAHGETKSDFEMREQESEKVYREKLEQLEQDYQSAVSYVKGTEKMLKRMKDELTKSKAMNTRLQSDLDKALHTESSRGIESEPPADWETERQSLRREIEEMQESVKGSVFQLERQMSEVRAELRSAQEERDHFRASEEQTQQHLRQTTEQARADLEQLKSENSRLESRAVDAETKVSLLLDQVESSVDNYRRQSHLPLVNGIIMGGGVGGSHTRNLSTNSTFNLGGHSHSNSIGAESAFSTSGANDRNSMALDSLASELETLRTQWEGTHRTYRLSSQFDFERTPTTTTTTTMTGTGTMAGSAGGGAGGELSDSLASWRKRLDAEEREREGGRGEMEEGRSGERERERERERGGMTSPLRRRADEEGGLNVI